MTSTNWASDYNMSIAAINTVIDKVHGVDVPKERKKLGKWSPKLLMLGEEKAFLSELASHPSVAARETHISGDLSRAEEMCFAIFNCDSLLITAPMSTFGFWIGFLMQDNSPIYYIANSIDTKQSPQKRENFPPEWHPIVV